MTVDLHEYQWFVEGMASKRSTRDLESRLLTSAVGLAGEAGEFADMVKKAIFHESGVDPGKLADELGDVLWYCAFAATSLGISLQSAIEQNMEKLRKRYKTGTFTIEEFRAKEAAKQA